MSGNSTRIADVDALRGFALFGILQVNILAFSSVVYGTGAQPFVAETPLGHVLSCIISAGFELKFYLLFSFLFGYSFTLQMYSAQKSGEGFMLRFLRRQAGLFAIGFVHAIVLFHGDILTTYAVLGLVLLLVKTLSDRTLLWLAAGLVLLCTVLWAGIAVLQALSPSIDMNTPEIISRTTQMVKAYRGTASEVIGQHMESILDMLPLLALIQAPCALAMFMLGLVLGRRQLLAMPEIYRPYLVPAMRYGVLIGLPGALFYAFVTQQYPASAWETIGLALSLATAPFLTMAYIAGALIVFERLRDGVGHKLLANAGRMALSNYLLQSVICGMIFYGYGLGLIDHLSVTSIVPIAWAIFASQLVISSLWLKHFRYGPVEWGLRLVTIWRLP